MSTPVRPPGPIQDIFEFRPRWWWDPVPPWVFEQLQPDVIRQIAVIQLGAMKTVLEAQQKALDQVAAVIQRAK